MQRSHIRADTEDDSTAFWKCAQGLVLHAQVAVVQIGLILGFEVFSVFLAGIEIITVDSEQIDAIGLK